LIRIWIEKYERGEYDDVAADLPKFIDTYDKAKRLHSALGYLSLNQYGEKNAPDRSKEKPDLSSEWRPLHIRGNFELLLTTITPDLGGGPMAEAIHPVADCLVGNSDSPFRQKILRLVGFPSEMRCRAVHIAQA